MITNPIERHVAIHEAAHAAAMLVFKLYPTMATIEPKDRNLGWASHINGSVYSLRGLQEIVVVGYAGAEAEKLNHGNLNLIKIRAIGDDAETEKYLEDLGANEEEMREETQRLLQKHWQLVERLADELLEYGTLEYGELSEIYHIYRGESEEENLTSYRRSAAYLGMFEQLHGRRKSRP